MQANSRPTDTNLHQAGHVNFAYLINLAYFWFFDKKFILKKNENNIENIKYKESNCIK